MPNNTFRKTSLQTSLQIHPKQKANRKMTSLRSGVKMGLMKKLLSSCADCGEDKSILTQVGCAAEVIYLCSDCYNLKYSKEVQKEIEEDYLIPDFLKN